MNKINVLYIEDDPLDRMAVERMIRKQNLNFRLFSAESIAQTKELVAEELLFDVVIADYLLKDGNAFEIFELSYPAPIIFITGAGNEEIAIKAMRNGAYDYLIKDRERNYLKILPITIDNAIANYRRKERLQLLESSVLKVKDAIVITRADFKNPGKSLVIFQNQEFTNLTGYKPKELYQQDLSCLKGPKTNIGELERVNKKLKMLESVRSELIYYKKSGEPFWVDMTVVPIFSETSLCTHFVSVSRDITEKKHNEAELIKAKKMAEEAKKAEEHFLAVMSHEIRTPMNSIAGLVNLLLDTNLNSEQLDYVYSFKTAADNLLALVNDILDLSKIERGKIEFTKITFNIQQLIKNTVQTLKYLAEEKGISLIISNDINLPTFVKGDALRLNQIVTNLLNNAIKFTETGEIVIKTKVLNKNLHQIKLQIQFIDSGIGIEEDKIATIFQKYEQINRNQYTQYSGTGLGLYIVKQLVELQNGKIYVESKKGQGSTFTIILDFDYTASIATRLPNPFKENKNLKQARILVGEDNVMNKRIVKKMLEKWQANVNILSNGKQVVECLANNDFDLLLLDIQMPEMDGIQTIQFIRNRLQLSLPIIVMTASAFTNKHDIIKEKIDGFIQKPFAPATLFDMISKCLEEQKNKTLEIIPIVVPATSIKVKYDIQNTQKKCYNLDYLRKISRNNIQFIKEMINIFIMQTDEVLRTVPILLKEKDYAGIQNIAHKLKSSANNVGNQAMAKNCQILEKLIGRQPQHPNIHILSKSFMAECAKTKEQLLSELEKMENSVKIEV